MSDVPLQLGTEYSRGKGNWILTLVLEALQKHCSLLLWNRKGFTKLDPHGAVRGVPEHPWLG